MAQTMEIPTAGPETYCRLCLGTDDLQRVFREKENTASREENGVAAMLQGAELVEKIYECTNIKLSSSTDADCAICRRCLQAVEDFYHFRVRSKRVNDLIHTVNTEVAAVVGPVAVAGVATAAVSKGNEPTVGSKSSTVRHVPVAIRIKVEGAVPAKQGLHRCRYCPKSFRTLAGLTEHGNRAHVSNRQHHCPNCLEQFQHAPSLARHMRNRSCFAFTKYRCRVCSGSFPDREQWAAHIRVHAKDFPFQCPDCWSQFKHKATLRRHANTVHLLVQC